LKPVFHLKIKVYEKQETTRLLKALKYPADIREVYIFSTEEVIINT
jgi:hypothetical protein